MRLSWAWFPKVLHIYLFADDTTEESGEGDVEEIISYTISGEVNFISSKMNR